MNVNSLTHIQGLAVHFMKLKLTQLSGILKLSHNTLILSPNYDCVFITWGVFKNPSALTAAHSFNQNLCVGTQVSVKTPKYYDVQPRSNVTFTTFCLIFKCSFYPFVAEHISKTIMKLCPISGSKRRGKYISYLALPAQYLFKS